MSDKKTDIINGPIFKNMLLFTIPVILTGVLQILYNAADVIVVGRVVGSRSLAAVGATTSIIHIFVNLFIGLSAGASVCVARGIGKGDKDGIEKTVHTSVLIAFIGGIILAVIGFFSARTLLQKIQTPSDILEEASLYMKIIFLGMPANLVYNFGAGILRAEGNTKTPLLFLSLSGIINVILNLIFVICFNMRADGVGLATIVSQFISAIFVIIYLMRSKTDCKLYLSKLKIHIKTLIDVMKIGIPAGLQGCVFSISNIVIQSSVNSLGSVVVAGNSASMNIEGFTFTAMNSFHQSMLTFVGQHVGAKKIERIKKVILNGCAQVTIVGVVLGFLMLLFIRPILNLYVPGDEAVIQSGIDRAMIILPTYFMCGWMDLLVGATRGMGESLKPMIISILGVCGIRIIWIYTVFAHFKSAASIYISYPVSWLVTALLQMIMCIIIYKKTQKMYNN